MVSALISHPALEGVATMDVLCMHGQSDTVLDAMQMQRIIVVFPMGWPGTGVDGLQFRSACWLHTLAYRSPYTFKSCSKQAQGIQGPHCCLGSCQTASSINRCIPGHCTAANLQCCRMALSALLLLLNRFGLLEVSDFPCHVQDSFLSLRVLLCGFCYSLLQYLQS